ncbi:hypothetical protein FXB39_02830 [Nocardioides sp. BGMRC 2183]|nr:hypothetical protein FXB39_02830 [Nocardioides sp. BGMRC 2183]
MIGVDEARRLAHDKLTKKLTSWAVEPPAAPAMAVALKPPTEHAALADQSAAEAWVRAWRGVVLPPGAEVDWETRDWKRLGRQDVPVRLRLAGADVVAGFAKGTAARDWARLTRRLAAVRDALGPSAALDTALRRHATTLLGWPDDRFERVLAVVAWLSTYPSEGLRPRQVPIRGVDTKWLAKHRAVVTDLHAAATGAEGLGLVEADRLVRVRILDPALAVGGLRDLAAPAAQLATLPVAPAVVLVLENLESMLALPSWPGVVALHGSGYDVDAAGRLPWAQQARVVYWGDLDSHGFAILHRLRFWLPDVTTILMDEQTLLDHRDLWVPEPQPTRAELDSLTPGEAAALARLRSEGDVRLEQERIPWAVALPVLEAAVGLR